MKFSRVSALVLSLLVILGVSFAATTDKTLEFDLRHSVQHIGSEVRIQTAAGGANVASLMQDHGKVRVLVTSNFLLSTGNSIASGSLKSNILGGEDNDVGNADVLSEGSTIIAGEHNKNFSHYSTIGGGRENKILYGGMRNVIVGGSENQIESGQYSVILGGERNIVAGEKSATVGVNNEVRGNYSVALGSGAIISGGNNSFLWTDNGETLQASDVFAVVGERGMVINASLAHELAQLTVGGSIVVGEGTGDSMIQCDEHGVGIIKMVDKIGDQKCLCSCNGSSWDSLLGDGQCKSFCNGGAVSAKCGTEVTVFTGDDGIKQYSGSCESGSVVEGSYYVSTSNIWWTCQEANGSVEFCSHPLGCSGTIPEHGHRNNNVSPNDQYSYYFSNNPGDICSFSCDDGYAWSGSRCQQICNYSASTCNFGERLFSTGSRVKEYTYFCRYNLFDYKCETACSDGYVWAGDSGALTGCQPETAACSSTTGYVCNLGTPYTGGIIDTNDLEFKWECIDSSNQRIGNCHLAKPVRNVNVYFDKQEITSGTVISFRITGAIDTGIQIKLHRNASQSEIFEITGGLLKSDGKPYYESVSSYVAKFLNGQSNINIAMPTLVYHLQLVDGESIQNLCSSSCEFAGSCRYGATSSSFSSGINGNTVTFRWTCRSGSAVDTGCIASCSIKAGNCTSVPTNAISCNANFNGCAPLKGANINLSNFYLDGVGNVTSNGSGNRKHCVYNGGKITCTEASNPGEWLGWKCNSGFTMDTGSCACRGGSACNSNVYNASCTYGSTILTGPLYTNSYTYRCSLSDGTCSAKCATGRVWAGETLGCVESLALCTNDDTSHSCAYGAERKYLSGSNSLNTWVWKCEIGELSNVCHHCLSGYTWNESLGLCTASSIGCESTGITLDSITYNVLALANGVSTGVSGRNFVKSCSGTATCTNGVVSIGSLNCINACGTGTSNTPKCNLGSASNADGTTYKKTYGYYCKDGSWTYTKCSIDCNSGKYWNGTSCADAPAVCSGTHYNCVAPGQFVAGSSTYGNNLYTWRCLTGDVLGECSEEEEVVHTCHNGTVDGYKVPSGVLLGSNTGVYKYTDEGKCTARAVCGNGYARTIILETCPSTIACNSNGGCNLGTAGGYDGATYSNSYNYKCYGDRTWNCSASCPRDKVWAGETLGCVDDAGGCINGSHYNCTGTAAGASNTANVEKGYYWDCVNGDGKKLNTDRCYECKSGYVYNGTTKACEGKLLTCSGTAPTHSIQGTSTYTYSGTVYSWSKTTGTLGLCQYKCDTNYNSGDNCGAEMVACKGSYPSDHVTLGGSTYLYNGSDKYWAGVTYSVLGNCQFRCDAGYYASGSTCAQVCSSSYDGCNGGYTPSGTLWAKSYTCNGSICNCTNINSLARWNGSECETISNVCHNDVSVPSAQGCNAGYYSGHVYGSGYVRNCVDADRTNINGELCHKCNDGYIWDSSDSVCVERQYYYYISFDLETHLPQGNRGTEIIIDIEDENGNSASIQDDKLLVYYRMYSSNGSDFSYTMDIGNADDGDVVDGIPELLGYELSEIEFSEDNDGEVIIDSDRTTATIGNNVYYLVD